MERLEAAVDHAVFGFHGRSGEIRGLPQRLFPRDLTDAPQRLLACPERVFKRRNRVLGDGEKEAAGGLRVEQDVAHLFADARRQRAPCRPGSAGCVRRRRW